MKKIVEFFDYVGMKSGCHRRADRSFHYKGYQFPVCARCTGVGIGNILGMVGLFIMDPPFLILLFGCVIMFFDWYIQYIDIMESTNIRRFITGIIGGYAFTTLYMQVLIFIVGYIIKNI